MTNHNTSQISYDVPAKINLYLDITGQRADGYHLVNMLMQTISLYDRVTLSRCQEADYMTCSMEGLEIDDSNLCMKALRRMKEHFHLTGNYHIHLEKKIPMAAGLAGGSADAAAVIRALETLEGIETKTRELEEIAVKLGADVPYCLTGGGMLCEGIGEILTPIQGIPRTHVLLMKPPVGVSTKEVYEAYDSCDNVDHPDTELLINKAMDGQMHSFAEHMKNVLEQVTAPKHPIINELEVALRKNGAYGSMMSGSGPTVFGLFDTEERCKAAYDHLSLQYPGFEIFMAHFTEATWN